MPSRGFSGIIPSTFNDSSPRRYPRLVPFCALSSLGRRASFPPPLSTFRSLYTRSTECKYPAWRLYIATIRTPPRWDFCGKSNFFSAVLTADQNSSLREKRTIVDRAARIFVPAIVRAIHIVTRAWGLNTCAKLYTCPTEYPREVLVKF